MAIKFTSEKGIIGGKNLSAQEQFIDIVGDTAEDIANLPAYGEAVTDMTGLSVIPAKLSLAYTADLSVGYMLSPSGVWTKFRG